MLEAQEYILRIKGHVRPSSDLSLGISCADQASDSAARDHHLSRAVLHQAWAGVIHQARHPVPGGDGGAAEAVRQGPFV